MNILKQPNLLDLRRWTKNIILGVSPATIRNEMVALTKAGYLKQPHTSAGRIPTPVAMKFYINQLMEEKQMSLVDEVKAKEEVWDSRDDIDELMDEATHALAARTKSLAVAALKGQEKDRFWQQDILIFSIIPNLPRWQLVKIFFQFLKNLIKWTDFFLEWRSQPLPLKFYLVKNLAGRNLCRRELFQPILRLRVSPGHLGVIGPARANYGTVIPILRYFGNLIEEVANG